MVHLVARGSPEPPKWLAIINKDLGTYTESLPGGGIEIGYRRYGPGG